MYLHRTAPCVPSCRGKGGGVTSQPGMADPAPMCQDLMAFQGHVYILEGLCEDKHGASGVRAALHVAQTDPTLGAVDAQARS